METKDYFLIALVCFVIYLISWTCYHAWREEFVYIGVYDYDKKPIGLNYYFFLFPIWFVSFSVTIGFVLAGFIRYFLERTRKRGKE